MEIPNSTIDSPRGWRTLFPVRWEWLLVYGAILLVLKVWLPTYDGWQMQSFQFAVRALLWDGVAVIVALVAMMRISIRHRVTVLLAIEVVRLYVTLQGTVVDQTTFLTSRDLFLLLRNRLAVDAVDFAFVSLAAHVGTSLCGAFVSPRAPQQSELERGTQGGIAEWAYLAVLVGLVCMPQPKVNLSLSQIIWEPFGMASILRLLFEGQNRLVLPLLGLLVLALPRGWRLSVVMLILILAVASGTPFYYAWWMRPRSTFRWTDVLRGFSPTFVLMIFRSLPFWVLLWVAGYRLYSPRRWIGAAEVTDRQVAEGVAP